ncbi:MAG: acetylxylan esterase [Bacteroidia bacterium]|nr:acetylxylan esterase [Bacteroidia bacterium]
MKKTLIMLAAAMLCVSAAAQVKGVRVFPEDPVSPALENYFSPCTGTEVAPLAGGFIQRWTLLEPIAKPEIRSNTLFTDTWLRNEFAKEYFDGQNTILPVDGQKVKLYEKAKLPGDTQKVKVDKKSKLVWHSFDATRYNVKLYRFATGLGLRPTEGLFLAVTVINCPEDMTVRMSVGSNSGSMWWLDGEEVILLSGDRRMVVDDCVSKEITLKKGKNVLRGAVINGPGMSDFCVRFLDKAGKPVTNFTVSNQ